MEDRFLKLKIEDLLEPKIILSLLSEYKNLSLDDRKHKIDKIIKTKFSMFLKDIGLINSVEGLEFFERLCALFIIIYFLKDKGLNEKNCTYPNNFAVEGHVPLALMREKVVAARGKQKEMRRRKWLRGESLMSRTTEMNCWRRWTAQV